MYTLSFGKMPADLHASITTTKPKVAGLSLTWTKGEDLLRTFSEDWVENGLFGQYLHLDKLGLLDQWVLVLKKRTRQLIDLTSLWRRVVLEERDYQVVKQLEGLQPSTLDWWILRKETKEAKCEGDWSGLQEIPQLNYSMEYVTTHLQEIPQRIRWGSWRE